MNGILQSVFALLVLVVLGNAIYVIAKALRAGGYLPTTEVAHEPSSLVEPSGLFPTAEERATMAERRELVGAGRGSGRESPALGDGPGTGAGQ